MGAVLVDEKDGSACGEAAAVRGSEIVEGHDRYHEDRKNERAAAKTHAELRISNGEWRMKNEPGSARDVCLVTS